MDKINYSTGCLTSLEFLLGLSETLDDYNFGQLLEFLIEDYGILWDSCDAPGNALLVETLRMRDTASDATDTTTSPFRQVDNTSIENTILYVHSGWAITREYITVTDEDGTSCETRLVPVIIHVPEDETIITQVLPVQEDVWSLFIQYDETTTCPYGAKLCTEETSLRKQKSYRLWLEEGDIPTDDVPGKIRLAKITFADTLTEEGFRVINTVEDTRNEYGRLTFKNSFICPDSTDSTEFDYINDGHIIHFNTSISSCAFAGQKEKLLDDYMKSQHSAGIDMPPIVEYAFLSNRGASPKDGFALLEPVGPFNGAAAFFDTDLRNFIKNTSFSWTYHCQFVEEVIGEDSTSNLGNVVGVPGPTWTGSRPVTHYYGFQTAFPGWYRKSYSGGTYETSWLLPQYECHWWFFGPNTWTYNITDYTQPTPSFSNFGTVKDAYLHPYGTKWIIIPGYQSIISGRTYIVGKPQGYLVGLMTTDEDGEGNKYVNIYKPDSTAHLYPVPWLFYDETTEHGLFSNPKVYWDINYIKPDNFGIEETIQIAAQRLVTGGYDSIHFWNTFSDLAFDKINSPNTGFRYKQLAKYFTVWAYVSGVQNQWVCIRIWRVTHPNPDDDDYGLSSNNVYQCVASKTVLLPHSGPQVIYASFSTTGTGEDKLDLNPNDGDTSTDYRYAVEIINLHGSYDLKVMTIQVVPGIGDAPFMPHFGFIPEWGASTNSIVDTVQGYNKLAHLRSIPTNIEPPWTEGAFYNALSYWDILAKTVPDAESMSGSPEFNWDRIRPLLSYKQQETCYLWYDIQRGFGFENVRKFTFSVWARFRPIIEFYPTAGGDGNDEYPSQSDRFLLFAMVDTNKYEEEICVDNVGWTTETITVENYIELFRRKTDRTDEVTGNNIYELVLRFDNGDAAEEIAVELESDFNSSFYTDFHLITATWDLDDGTAYLMIDTSYYGRNLNNTYANNYKYISIGGWKPDVDIPSLTYLHAGQLWIDELFVVNKFITPAEHTIFYSNTRNPFTMPIEKISLGAYSFSQKTQQIVSNPTVWHAIAMNAIHNWNWYAFRDENNEMRNWDSDYISDFARYNIFSVGPWEDITKVPTIGFANILQIWGDTSNGVIGFYPHALGYCQKVIQGESSDTTVSPITWTHFRKNLTTGFINPGLFELNRDVLTPNTVSLQFNVFLNVYTINSFFTGKHDSSVSGAVDYPMPYFSYGSTYYKDTHPRAYDHPGLYYVPKRTAHNVGGAGGPSITWSELINYWNWYAPRSLNMITFGTLIPYLIDANDYKQDATATEFFDNDRIPAKLPHQYGEAIFGAVIYNILYRYNVVSPFDNDNGTYFLMEPGKTNVQNIVRDAILIPFRTSLMASSWFASGSEIPFINTFYNPDSTDLDGTVSYTSAEEHDWGGFSSTLKTQVPVPYSEEVDVHSNHYSGHTADGDMKATIYFGHQFVAGLLEHLTQNNIIINIWDLTPAFTTRLYHDVVADDMKFEFGHARIKVNEITNNLDNPEAGDNIENIGWDFDMYKSISIQMIGLMEVFDYNRWWPPTLGILNVFPPIGTEGTEQKTT